MDGALHYIRILSISGTSSEQKLDKTKGTDCGYNTWHYRSLNINKDVLEKCVCSIGVSFFTCLTSIGHGLYVVAVALVSCPVS